MLNTVEAAGKKLETQLQIHKQVKDQDSEPKLCCVMLRYAKQLLILIKAILMKETLPSYRFLVLNSK